MAKRQKRVRVLVTRSQYLKAAIGDFSDVSCPFASAAQKKAARAAKAAKQKTGRKK